MVSIARTDKPPAGDYGRRAAPNRRIARTRVHHVHQNGPPKYRPFAFAGTRYGHALSVLWSAHSFAGSHRTLRPDGPRSHAKDARDGNPRGPRGFAQERLENDSARNACPCSWRSVDWTALRACGLAAHRPPSVWTFAE